MGIPSRPNEETRNFACILLGKITPLSSLNLGPAGSRNKKPPADKKDNWTLFEVANALGAPAVDLKRLELRAQAASVSRT